MLRFLIVLVAAFSWYIYNNHEVLVHKWMGFALDLETQILQRVEAPVTNADKCKVVHKEFGACEDLIVDESTGLIYLPCADPALRQVFFPGGGHFNYSGLEEGQNRNKVYLYDPSKDKVVDLELRGYDGEDFINHGLDVLFDEEDNTKRTLFFVNHKNGQSVISVFSHSLGDDHIDHLYDVRDPLISTPNAVTAVGPNAFYTTNDHAFRLPPMRDLVGALGSYGRLSTVIYCEKFGESTRCEKKASRFPYPNGIVSFDNHNKVAVADTMLGAVTIYRRDPASNDLTEIKRVPLGSMLDNIRVNSDGDLIATTLPNPRQIIARLSDMGNKEKRPDSQSIRLSKSDDYSTPEVVYRDNGNYLSFMTGSLIDPSSNKLYGGSVADEGLLICQL
ncbi:hypothetical protein TRICI_001367 [Trichomonascus ciferrii]|uniref:SMP-30/Gluconolactonase/LRE-like region domain-containing protein n=1 Tax=Trichomonascus ciferrii TaxID=44093 RepID=A0A642VCN3_9ASCO|nr:hypothetical protein TRICI_001367 [Trichomonascus ciferrii]